MGIIAKLQIWAAVFVVLLQLATTTAANKFRCDPGVQYFDHNLQTCSNCTKCDGAEELVIIRPCQMHRDAMCGTLAQLLEGTRMRHHRHRHRKHPDDGDEEVKVEDVSVKQEQMLPMVDRAPFTGAETLIWDWQAIALTCAVFTCILFFLVIAVYSMHQARQWRRLKENFDTDVEELSAKLSLMAANSSERGEVLEPSSGPIRDSHYLNNRCMYLEQLLQVRKEKKPECEAGNVYIQETSGKFTA